MCAVQVLTCTRGLSTPRVMMTA